MFWAAYCMIRRPVTVSPVNAIFAIRLLVASAIPISAPGPLTMLSTPGGTISSISSASFRIDQGVGLAGLIRASAQGKDAFRVFVEGLWPEAQAKGVSRATFDKAFAGVEADLSLPDLVLPGKTERDVKGQAEFTKTPAEYLNAAYLAKLAEQGKALLAKHAAALAKIEREIGVQRQFVLAIWGRETAFGTYRAPHYAIQVLATQAYLGRRKELFRNELMHALKMLQDGVRHPRDHEGVVGRRHGPHAVHAVANTTTLAYDLDGDGRKDIWNSVPDALASTANQLRA